MPNARMIGSAPRWPALFLAVLLLISPMPSATASTEQAEAFLRNLTKRALTMLDPEFGTKSDREAEFLRIVGDGFAMETIGRFVAGPYWRNMTDEQRTSYQTLFRSWLVDSYAGSLRALPGQQVKFLRTIEASPTDTFVRTWISQDMGGPPVVADWRIRDFDGRYQIIDIVVEGVSMAAAQRAEIQSVLRKDGIDGLIENLRAREKNNKIKAG